MQFGEHPLVCHCLKGIFKLKPALPRYSKIWDVKIVLNYLESFKAPSALCLKDLTLKLTMLLCLTTAQRAQTIHMLDTNYIQELDDGYHITVQGNLKQTKPGKHLKPIELVAFKDNESLCVVKHLKEYLHKTMQLRNGHFQLLLSYQRPHCPVSKDTISRWTKSVLESAGIDVNIYKGHSTRSCIFFLL